MEDAERFTFLVREYLNVEIDYLGHIENDERVVDACENMRPFLLEEHTSKVSLSLYSILFNMGVHDRQLRQKVQRGETGVKAMEGVAPP